ERSWLALQRRHKNASQLFESAKLFRIEEALRSLSNQIGLSHCKLRDILRLLLNRPFGCCSSLRRRLLRGGHGSDGRRHQQILDKSPAFHRWHLHELYRIARERRVR